MRKNCTPGSVRGAARKGGSYRGGRPPPDRGWPWAGPLDWSREVATCTLQYC